eukprot:scaffold4851_cov126-Isochrysis_galbana.AAC.3
MPPIWPCRPLPRLQQRRRGQGEPPPCASRNNSRAYAAHRHAQLRAGAGGPAAAFIRRQPRDQPLPRLKIAPPRLQQRRRGQGEPPPRANRNYSRAYAAHLLPPARPAARWGWGPGCRLHPPPAARPRDQPLPRLKIAPPRLQQRR